MSNTNGSTSKGNGNTSKSNGTTDGKAKGGVAFGTSVVYTDAYNNDEFVTWHRNGFNHSLEWHHYFMPFWLSLSVNIS
jgi:hypothetical protein